MKTITKAQILEKRASISDSVLIEKIADAFVQYSKGNTQVPPVGHLNFKSPPGDVHIKYGAIEGFDNYVIKIASGFYDNAKIGLPTSNGLMLVFDTHTGQPKTTLLDEGYLTDLRTGIAGAICSKYIGPKEVRKIGIVGTGIQSRFQLECLKSVTECKKVVVWGRSNEKASAYQNEMNSKGYEVRVATSIQDLVESCNLIITTTPVNSAIIKGEWIKAGTHITAMGSDTPGKGELDLTCLQRADAIVVDSISQCKTQGELQKSPDIKVFELGDWIDQKRIRNNDDITIADLTGVAVQDIAIANLFI